LAEPKLKAVVEALVELLEKDRVLTKTGFAKWKDEIRAQVLRDTAGRK
jgi:hypothetical protein